LEKEKIIISHNILGVSEVTGFYKIKERENE